MVTLIKLVLSRKPTLCKRTLAIAGKLSATASLRFRGLVRLKPTHMPIARAEE